MAEKETLPVVSPSEPAGGGEKRHMGMAKKKKIVNGVSYTTLILISIIWIIPFVFLLLQSFRCESTNNVSYIWPQQWGWDNYVYIFTPSNENAFLKWYANTFIMALVVCILQTALIMMMSYTLSRFRFKLRKPMMNFMLVLGMFPGFLTMIILFQVLSLFGLIGANAVAGLIIVYVASSGMGYYVSKGFLDTLPKSLDEAALVDGATRFQIFYKVILPLSKPIIIYTVLTAFMGPWGDFVFASYIANGVNSARNVADGLFTWVTTYEGAHFTHFCAGGVIVAIPVMILFLFLQKYYVEGVTGGAVKG